MHFTWKILSNHVFEDLRRTKAPNNWCSQHRPELIPHVVMSRSSRRQAVVIFGMLIYISLGIKICAGDGVSESQ
jgi:hypothetical protein